MDVISETTEPALAGIQQALPEGFDFYSLGMLEVAPFPTDHADTAATMADEELSELALVAFRYSGDARGAIVIAFERCLESVLDTSMHGEMGNILASRFADSLASLDAEGVGILITPPSELAPAQLTKMLKASAGRRVERTYHYFSKSGKTTVPVRMLILPDASRTEARHV